MTRNVKILDCTLRDGARIIDCAIPQFHIDGIIRGLVQARVDFIELGFLRGNTTYRGNSTFFSDMEQARQCVPAQKGNSSFVLFADYGEEYGGWDFSKLPECDGKTVTGIRLGFRKEDFQGARETMKRIQGMGYLLFAQPVETSRYSDLDFLHALEDLNAIKPHAIGIVDTFGCMYKPQLTRYYTMADHNLDHEITIDFHTHNNMQLSFSFAQEIVSLSNGKREVILDATLGGMGKGAGNLNIELIVEYLISQHGYGYQIDNILDAIDEHIQWIKNDHSWGYSLPSLMSALFRSHPNNVEYLLKKNRLRTKDIRYILASVDADTRKRYDYDKLDRVYLEYSLSRVNDSETLNQLGVELQERPVLVVVFGTTSRTHKNSVLQYIEEKNPVIISVNHVYQEAVPNYVFHGNHRRYKNDDHSDGSVKRIVSSNIPSENINDIVVDYSKLISIGYSNYDNSTIMLLNLLRNIGVEEIAIAGLDGYADNPSEVYSNEVLAHNAPHEKLSDANNMVMKDLLIHFAESLTEKHSVCMLTPSRFENIFNSRI